jgi:hypothetical protein
MAGDRRLLARRLRPGTVRLDLRPVENDREQHMMGSPGLVSVKIIEDHSPPRMVVVIFAKEQRRQEQAAEVGIVLLTVQEWEDEIAPVICSLESSSQRKKNFPGLFPFSAPEIEWDQGQVTVLLAAKAVENHRPEDAPALFDTIVRIERTNRMLDPLTGRVQFEDWPEHSHLVAAGRPLEPSSAGAGCASSVFFSISTTGHRCTSPVAHPPARASGSIQASRARHRTGSEDGLTGRPCRQATAPRRAAGG